MRLKAKARQFLNEYKLGHAIRAIRRLPAGEVPDRQTLIELVAGWSNDGFVARVDYLHEVARRAATTEGPILECGSGITTVLMGLVTKERHVKVYSLEHHPEWHHKVESVLKRNQLTNVHACLSPLRNYGEFDWYEPPLESLPNNFTLVVCDGPPGSTKGGRYGLLPVMGSRLPTNSVILLDDTDRPEEQAIMKRWKTESGLQDEIVNGQSAAFGVLSRRGS